MCLQISDGLVGPVWVFLLLQSLNGHLIEGDHVVELLKLGTKRNGSEANKQIAPHTVE